MSGSTLPLFTNVNSQPLWTTQGSFSGAVTFNSNVTVNPDSNPPYGMYMLKAGPNYFNITQGEPTVQSIIQARSVNPDASISTSLTMVCGGSGGSLTYGTAALGASGVIAFQNSAGMQLSNVSSLSYGATAIPVDKLISSCQGFFGL